MKLGYVAESGLDAGIQVLLFDVIEHVGRHDRHIDAAQVSKIGQSLQRSLANHRHYPAGRSIIDQVREIFGHPDGYAGATRGFELDDSAV